MAGTNYPSQLPVFIQSGDPETENRPADSYSPGQLGATFSYKSPAAGALQKGYQVVQVDSAVGTAIAVGHVAYWRNASGYIVTNDPAVAGRGNPAGVFNVAATVDYICCIQTQGRAATQIVSPSTSTPDQSGKLVIPSTTAGKADVLAAGSAATYPILGRCVGFLLSGLAYVELDPPRRA